MWQLKKRGEHRDWSELGSFESIGAASRRVLELDRDHSDQPVGSLFFRVYADPLMDKSDAEILSRLEYQGTNGFYVLTRRAN